MYFKYVHIYLKVQKYRQAEPYYLGYELMDHRGEQPDNFGYGRMKSKA